MDLSKLHEVLDDELNNLIGYLMYDSQNNNNKVILNEVDSDDNVTNLYLLYSRKYYQTEVKFKNGAIAGWSKENAKRKGTSITVEIVFPKNIDIYDETMTITVIGYYRGQQMNSEIVVSEREVYYGASSNNIESGTVTNAISTITEIIKNKIAHCCEDMED